MGHNIRIANQFLEGIDKFLHRNPPWIIAVLIAVLICNCYHENNQLQISFEGKSYSYEKIRHKIKDLEEEPINTSWIKTENCIIQYSSEYEEFLGNIISSAEEGYKRVSADLLFDSKDPKVRIWFLNSAEFKRISRASSGAIATRDNEGTAIINLDQHKFGDDAAEVVPHEITHIIAGRISGTSYRIMLKKHPQYAQSFSSFNEALAQNEDRLHGTIEEMLFHSFPNMDFITLEVIDSQKNTEKNQFRSIREMRALIKFIKDEWGPETLVEIVRTVGKHGLARAIEKCTNMPIDEFQIKWFEYMMDMLSEYQEQSRSIP